MPSAQNIVMDLIVIGLIVASYVYGKYISPKLHPGAPNQAELAINELRVMGDYASKFVVWAREFLKGKSGTDKMDEVLAKLQEITKMYNINMNNDQLKAIAQSAYESMKVKDEAASAHAITEKALEVVKEVAASKPESTEKVAMLSDDVKVIKEESGK